MRTKKGRRIRQNKNYNDKNNNNTKVNDGAYSAYSRNSGNSNEYVYTNTTRQRVVLFVISVLVLWQIIIAFSTLSLPQQLSSQPIINTAITLPTVVMDSPPNNKTETTRQIVLPDDDDEKRNSNSNSTDTDSDTDTDDTALKSTLYPCSDSGSDIDNPKLCQCLVVHDVCIDHKGGNNKIWYYKFSINDKLMRNEPLQEKIKIPYQFDDQKYKFRVEHKTSSQQQQQQQGRQKCVDSSVPNHMIWSGLYLDMLGEFYMRAFTSFINLYVNLPKQQQLNFYTTTQLYVVTKKLLLSHKTFLNIVSNRPSNNNGVSVLSYKQLLKYGPTTKSLQPPNPNNNQTKHNIPQCTCVKRLYFCSGVEAEAEAKVDGMENQQQERQQKNNSSSSSSMKRKRIHLSTGDIQQHIRSIGSPTKISIQKFRTQLILQSISSNNNNDTGIGTDTDTTIANNINESEYKIIGLTQRNSRRRWLYLDELIHECNRRWFYNQSNNTKKTLCVEINLETNNIINTSELQILWHASMDAIVGIHGAQLTHAVWLRPQSLIVELLPWVMDGLIVGGWTKDVTQPTPLGVIFDNTDLVHVGFPLNASSASHINCLQKSFTTTKSTNITTNTNIATNTTTSHNSTHSESKSKSKSLSSIDCMRKYKNRWDARDFSVPQDKLLHLLQQFVVDVDVHVDGDVVAVDTTNGNNGSNGSNGSSITGSIARERTRTRSTSSNILTCQDYQDLARDDYVIYNVMCSDNDNDNNPSSNKTSIHHFYRTKEWGDTKTNCTICTYD